MNERWTCARCSAENESWAVGCAKCGTVRADLSVAGAQSDATTPATPTSPSEGSPPADSTPAWGAPPQAQSPTPTPTPTPAWGGQVAQPASTSAVPPEEIAAISAGATPSSTPTGLEGYAPPPVAKEPLWKRLPLGLIVIGFFIAAGAVGGLIFNASRGESGEITKTGDLAATDLRAGDCFDLKDPSAEEIGDVTGIPCTAEHEYETFFIGTMPEGPFPNDDGFIAWLDGNCRPAFETYVGMAYENSELDIFWLQPTSEAWNDGDRSIQCALYHPRIHRLTESLKGSAR
jgi:Septum formation